MKLSMQPAGCMASTWADRRQMIAEQKSTAKRQSKLSKDNQKRIKEQSTQSKYLDADWFASSGESREFYLVEFHRIGFYQSSGIESERPGRKGAPATDSP